MKETQAKELKKFIFKLVFLFLGSVIFLIILNIAVTNKFKKVKDIEKIDRGGVLYWIGKNLGNDIVVKMEAQKVHALKKSSCNERKIAYSQYYIKARKGRYDEIGREEALKFMKQYLNDNMCPDLNPGAGAMLDMDMRGIHADQFYTDINGSKYIIPYD
jgi:preprotein translocase subunit SecG